MVETYTMTFYGSQLDPHGMPVPYHHYVVFAGPAPYLGPNGSVASIVPLTNATMPPQTTYPVKNGTPGHAAGQAIAALEALPQNRGLRKHENQQ
jgi:hypothetical protein